MTGQHDIGGLAAGPIDTSDHDPEPWQKMITAVYGALVSRGYSNVDEMRRTLEGLPQEQYDQPYYERWIESIRLIMVEKGVVSEAEIAERIDALSKATP